MAEKMSARISVRVRSRSRRTGISGMLGESYKLELMAPPENGKANQACIDYFAMVTGASRMRIRIISGFTHPSKIVEFLDLSPEQVSQKLEALL